MTTETLILLESHINSARVATERTKHELDEAYKLLKELKVER
jgi:hypothetical protein